MSVNLNRRRRFRAFLFHFSAYPVKNVAKEKRRGYCAQCYSGVSETGGIFRIVSLQDGSVICGKKYECGEKNQVVFSAFPQEENEEHYAVQGEEY